MSVPKIAWVSAPAILLTRGQRRLLRGGDAFAQGMRIRHHRALHFAPLAEMVHGAHIKEAGLERHLRDGQGAIFHGQTDIEEGHAACCVLSMHGDGVALLMDGTRWPPRMDA